MGLIGIISVTVQFMVQGKISEVSLSGAFFTKSLQFQWKKWKNILIVVNHIGESYTVLKIINIVFSFVYI